MPVVPRSFYRPAVPADLDRLAWLALMVVDEAAEQARSGRVQRTLGLRLALGYLCSMADGPTFALPSRRHIFDEFWKTVTAPETGNPHSAAYFRASMTETCMEQIGRQLQLGPDVLARVREARRPRSAGELVAGALEAADEERGRAKWRKRGGYFGRPYPGDEPRER